MSKQQVHARQRLVEIALRQSELRYRAMVEQRGEAVCRWLPDTTLTFVNEAYCRLFGKRRSDLLGCPWLKLVPSAQRSEVKAYFTALARRPRIHTHEQEITTPAGDRYWLSWKDVPLFDEQGRLFEFQTIGNDITTRKRYEEDLARKEEALKALLNNIPDLAWLKDEKSRFIAVNETLAAACNHSREDMAGKTDLDFWPPSLARHYRRDDRRVMRTRRRKQVEEPFTDHRGNTIWIETIKTPIFDARGKVTGTAGIARDVTGKRILMEQFKAGEVALRRALSLKDALARDLHDRIIQALYAVGLGLEDCRHLLPPGSDKARHRLRSSVDCLNAAIRELRAFITDAQKEDALFPSIDLSRDIRAFVKRIRAAQPARIRCRLSESACRRIGARRAGHVAGIIREAVSNSLRHARPKTIDISIRQSRGTLHVQVRDDGVGWNPKGKNHRGFGLKNIYNRVADMAGRLTLESTPGKGTVMRMALNENRPG